MYCKEDTLTVTREGDQYEVRLKGPQETIGELLFQSPFIDKAMGAAIAVSDWFARLAVKVIPRISKEVRHELCQ